MANGVCLSSFNVIILLEQFQKVTLREEIITAKVHITCLLTGHVYPLEIKLDEMQPTDFTGIS